MNSRPIVSTSSLSVHLLTTNANIYQLYAPYESVCINALKLSGAPE